MGLLLASRRLVLGVLGIASLTFLGYTKSVDVSLSVAAIVASVAGANAYQKRGAKDAE